MQDNNDPSYRNLAYGNEFKNAEASYNAPGWWMQFRSGFKGLFAEYNPRDLGRAAAGIVIAMFVVAALGMAIIAMVHLLVWVMGVTL